MKIDWLYDNIFTKGTDDQLDMNWQKYITDGLGARTDLMKIQPVQYLVLLFLQQIKIMNRKLACYWKTAENIKQNILLVGMNICFAVIIFYMIIRHFLMYINLDMKNYKCLPYLIT
ncbi:uncharacterized protein [Leptinotarsa decemlineata]|uniref:uncharacterized protein n=1 Tax=Leptinotarsa decemlineata TaxID=7539 RepID=UPI003D309320